LICNLYLTKQKVTNFGMINFEKKFGSSNKFFRFYNEYLVIGG